MTKLSERKTKLQFTTGAEVRYRGKMRPVVVEVSNEFIASVRLAGTRQRYPIAWETIFVKATEIAADHLRRDRKLARQARRMR